MTETVLEKEKWILISFGSHPAEDEPDDNVMCNYVFVGTEQRCRQEFEKLVVEGDVDDQTIILSKVKSVAFTEMAVENYPGD